MKKSLLFLSLVISFSFLRSQSSFQVTELIGGAAAQSHYIFNTDTSNINSPTVLLEFKITNTSGSSKITKIRKAPLAIATNTVSGTNHDMYFCYNATCFTPFTFYWYATIASGASLPNGGGTYGLRTEFDHNKVVGTSLVRYTIYDSTNTSDSVNITISYNVAAVTGIKNFNSNVFVSNASPNPASSSINFNYDLGNTDASVKIYNTLGNLVKTTLLNPTSKSTQIDVSSLEEGFYFYSVIANGKAISTKRLVIAR